MSDVILDASVAAIVGSAKSPELCSWLLKRQELGYRNWLYVAQQSEILRLMVKDAEDEGRSDPVSVARHRLALLTQSCMWLSALSEDGDTFEHEDPVAESLMCAAKRIHKEARILTDLSSRLEIGRPFVNIQSIGSEQLENLPITQVHLQAQQDQLRAGLESRLHRVLHHGKFIQGPEIEDLENDLANYVGVDYCLGVSSGTDALLIAMMALEIGAGDEVITTPFSFISTVEMIALIGATPIFSDVVPRTGNLDATRLESAITNKTRAIMPVSLYGQCADMSKINQIAQKYGLPVIEDAAQSFGATHWDRKSCGLSTVGCTSFFPAKPLGAYGDAGGIFTSDPDLAGIMRELRNHGQDRRYYHVRLGVNGRMDTIQAAVLREKLSVLDSELSQRELVARQYDELLQISPAPGLTPPFVRGENRSAWAQYTVKIDNRDHIHRALLDAGIPSAIHYPNVIFDQPAFCQSISNCPDSIEFSRRAISLPMHPYMESETQQRVIDCLRNALRSKNASE